MPPDNQFSDWTDRHAGCDPMVDELRKLRVAAHISPTAILITDAEARIEYANPAFTRTSGYSLEELVGNTPAVVQSGETPVETYRDLWQTIRAGKPWRGRLKNRTKSGEVRWEYQHIEPLTDAGGRITHFIAVREDITESRARMKALKLRERAIEATANAIMITDVRADDKPIVYVNPAFERTTGYRADEVLGRNGRFLAGDNLAQPGLEEIRAALRGRREGYAVLRNYRKDGTPFWNELYLAPVWGEDGEVEYYVSVINDISERKRQEDQLEYQASHDALTGLPNRHLLRDRAEQAIQYARRDGHSVAVMTLDIDRFNFVNESLGHAAGDELLRAVAERLHNHLGALDTVGRVSGDEFLVILGAINEADEALDVASSLRRALSRQFHIVGQNIFVSAGIGVATYPLDGEDADTLIRHSGIALHRGKEEGGGTLQLYNPSMSPGPADRLELETDLQYAASRGEFQLLFQPQLSLRERRVVGAEALLRWHHPRRGLISPIQFIPLAEDLGLIVNIGQWVIDAACAQLRAWREAGVAAVPVAVNISGRQFRHHDLTWTVSRALEHYQVPPEMLELELTETTVAQNPEMAAATLRELKAMGVRISLDDFGTGYSSLSHLKRFPIDRLKIDKAFVRQISQDADDAAIVRTIVGMAHGLGLDVVAEGVEGAEQVEYLRDCGCDILQGFYFSRPGVAECVLGPFNLEEFTQDEDAASGGATVP